MGDANSKLPCKIISFLLYVYIWVRSFTCPFSGWRKPSYIFRGWQERRSDFESERWATRERVRGGDFWRHAPVMVLVEVKRFYDVAWTPPPLDSRPALSLQWYSLFCIRCPDFRSRNLFPEVYTKLNAVFLH